MSILLNLIAWTHYLVILALPIVHILHRLAAERFPSDATGLAELAVGLTFVPYDRIRLGADWASGIGPSFVHLALALVPAFAVATLTWLTFRLDPGTRSLILPPDPSAAAAPE